MTVEWANADRFAHTTTSSSPDEKWNSGELQSGATFSHRFDRAGLFHYVCLIHPQMRGEVLVVP